MEGTMAETRRVTFTGTGIEALTWGIIYVLCAVFVVPTAWGAVAFSRWYVDSLKFSDGTRATFTGRGGEVWFLFVLAVLAGFIPLGTLFLVSDPTFFWIAYALSYVVTIAVIAVIYVRLLEWFIENVSLSCGTPLVFLGGVGSFVGWYLLMMISFVTIIGWAWVYVAFIRWVCENVDGETNHVEFHGTGGGMLWRGIVVMLASCFIVPIPWVWVWINKWIVENCVIVSEVE